MNTHKKLLEDLISDILHTVENNELTINNTMSEIDIRIKLENMNEINETDSDNISIFSNVDSVVTSQESTIEDIWKTLPTYQYIKKIKIGNTYLPVNDFKLNCLVSNSNICIIGKMGSGKSWLCRNIIHHLDNKNKIPKIIISSSDRISSFYKNSFKDALVYYKYNNKILDALIDRQIKSMRINKNDKSYNPQALLVIDDCFVNNTSISSTLKIDTDMRTMLMNVRSYKLTCLWTMQYPLSLEPYIRNNFDYIFLFAVDNIITQRKLYRYYGNIFPSFSAFKTVFDVLTKDHSCMVISNSSNSNEFYNNIFWFKAKN